MKRLLYLLLFISSFACAQDDNTPSRFEIKYGIGDAKLAKPKIIGGSSATVNNFSIYGVNGVFGINKNWGFELGLNYIPVKYTLHPAPGLAQPATSEDLSLLSVPLKARYNLGKYVFINGGLLIDFEVNSSGGVEKQSGLGANIGLGLKYDLANGIGFFLNPEFNARSLSRTKKGISVTKMTDAIVNFGLAYSF